MSIEIGETIGDYQIIALLGRGGMGKVFKVRNVISDRIEAMKALLSDVGETPELAERFIREIKVVVCLARNLSPAARSSCSAYSRPFGAKCSDSRPIPA